MNDIIGQPGASKSKFAVAVGKAIQNNEFEVTPVEDIKRFLTLLATMRGNPSGQEQLILDHGKEYRITPQTLEGERGIPKMCYQNAFNLAVDSDLTYVEGYVHIGIIPIEHAWCVDKDGNVIDPTLRRERAAGTEPLAYFGIPFSKKYIQLVALETGYYGVISHTNLPLLKGEVSPEEFLA